MNIGSIAGRLCVVVMVASIAACGHLPRKSAVPVANTVQAATRAVPGSRYWPDIELLPILELVQDAAVRERAALKLPDSAPNGLPPAYDLAISGGGDDGAFAAGLLAGWTAHGDRPVFKVVTGISAGALVAPFAFAGPQYDEVLKTVCSRIRSRDIFHIRNFLAFLTSDGVADDSPLAALIAKYVTAALMQDIAREYSKGRLLFIGTTDLDARQTVIWDMGAIASSADPRALGLFRRIMLASTSIPGVFPPVMFDVDIDGRPYQEMHVDGAVMRQVFLLPPNFVRTLNVESPSNHRKRHVFVIRNGRLAPEWHSVQRRATTVAHQAIDALVERTAARDLWRLQLVTEEDDDDFNIAYIEDTFQYPKKGIFVADYMHSLYAYSFALAAAGYPWRKTLPQVPLKSDTGH